MHQIIEFDISIIYFLNASPNLHPNAIVLKPQNLFGTNAHLFLLAYICNIASQ